MNIMNIPGFTAEDSLYRTNRHYQLTAGLVADNGSRVSPAVLKGTFCIVVDPGCSSGFSKLRCTGFDFDSCTETGVCCTPPPLPPPGPSNCGTHSCNPGHSCCANGCCPPGKFCCNNKGCCDNGRRCRTIFGKSFCSPL